MSPASRTTCPLTQSRQHTLQRCQHPGVRPGAALEHKSRQHNGYPTQFVAGYTDPASGYNANTGTAGYVPGHNVELQDAGGTDCTGTSEWLRVQLGTTGAGVGMGATVEGTKLVSSEGTIRPLADLCIVRIAIGEQ